MCESRLSFMHVLKYYVWMDLNIMYACIRVMYVCIYEFVNLLVCIYIIIINHYSSVQLLYSNVKCIRHISLYICVFIIVCLCLVYVCVMYLYLSFCTYFL